MGRAEPLAEERGLGMLDAISHREAPMMEVCWSRLICFSDIGDWRSSTFQDGHQPG